MKLLPLGHLEKDTSGLNRYIVRLVGDRVAKVYVVEHGMLLVMPEGYMVELFQSSQDHLFMGNYLGLPQQVYFEIDRGVLRWAQTERPSWGLGSV